MSRKPACTQEDLAVGPWRLQTDSQVPELNTEKGQRKWAESDGISSPAITEYHKLGGLSNRNASSQSGG